MGPALSRKIMSVLSQAESGDEDERTRYEITGIKGRVKSRARTGHRRNRNITIGINSVPRSASFRHLPGVSYRRPTSFFHPLARRPSSAKINRRFAIKISHGELSRRLSSENSVVVGRGSGGDGCGGGGDGGSRERRK